MKTTIAEWKQTENRRQKRCARRWPRPLWSGLAAGLVLLLHATGHAGTIAYQSPAPLAGNQNFSGVLGMDFDVGCGAIAVTSLGAFDADQDGMKRVIRVYIYDRDTQAAVAGPVEFSPGDDGALIGGSRFKPLPAPVVLPGGFHGTVAADNYGPEELLRGLGVGPFSTLDSGGGLISFVGSSRYGVTQGAFPGSADAGPANRYHAGTFEFEPGPGATIEAPPLSITVPDGQDAAFSVAATGVDPLTYRWQFNGADLPFENNAELLLFNVTEANAGDYRVLVTDGNGNVKCVEASLIVPPAGPVLAYDPSTITAATVESYGPGVGNFFDVVPGTSIVVSDLGTVLSESVLTNTVTVQLFNAAAASVLATVTFDAGDVPTPVASTPALNLYLKALASPLELGPGSYAVVLYGSSPGAQYTRNPTTPTVNGNGAIRHVGSRWTSPPGGPGVLPSNADGPGFNYLAGTFRLTVSGAPVITREPEGGIFAPGSDVTLEVEAGGSLPLSYQWRKGGADIGGATGPTFSLSGVSAEDGGTYEVVINNSLGSVTSTPVTLLVADPPTVSIAMHAGITIEGVVGLHYRVEYRESVDPPDTWQLLEDIPALPDSPYTVYDPAPATQPRRFYQVLLLP